MDGTQGSQGDFGPQGNEGPQGAQGDVGSQGAIGFQGSQGDVGAQGNEGPQGPQGAFGPQGAQGLIGPQNALDVPGEVDETPGAMHNLVTAGDLQLTWNVSPTGLLQLGVSGEVNADVAPVAPFDTTTVVFALPPATLVFTPVWDLSQKSGAGTIAQVGGLATRNLGGLSTISVSSNVVTLTFEMILDMIALGSTQPYHVSAFIQLVPTP